jgi:thiamine-phosphate pyrophosphorylase
LCYITDRHALEPRPLPPLIGEAVQAGIDLIQIREKDLPTRELLQLAESAVAAAKGSGTRIVVNDRLDIALAGGADGVHLGTQSIPAQAVRNIVPEGFLIGVSCHSRQDVLAAEAAGADYVVLGPIFETPSKSAYGPPLGLDVLRETAAAVNIAVLALGGISVERVRACLAAGAAGIAGIRIFQDSPALGARVRELRAQFL